MFKRINMRLNTIHFSIPFIILMLFSFNAKSQKKISFPFEVHHEGIIIKYQVKDTSLKFIFDTGSDLNIIPLEKAHLFNAKYCNEFRIINLGYLNLKLTSANAIDENIFGQKRCLINKKNLLTPEYNVDGLVGASGLLNKYIIDICFKDNLIKFFNHETFIKPSYSADLIELDIDKPSKGYETDASLLTADAASVSGEILISDTSKITTQFLIDTGSRFEIALMINDSSIIRQLSVGKEKYENFFGYSKELNYTFLKYKLLKDQYSPKIKSFIFYQEPSIFSIFGARKIGVLLGLPFFKRYKSVIIDNLDKKLYLVN